MKALHELVPRWLLAGLLALIGSACIFLLSRAPSTSDLGKADFVGYWSATYLLSNGENPYDLQSMDTLQHMRLKTGYDATIMAWNPPSLFVLLLPFSWLPFSAAQYLLLILNLIIVSAASWMLARLYLPGSDGKFAVVCLIVAITFPPVVSGIYMGQVTFFVLLGLVSCMVLIRRGQWFWAGAALILVTIKPHLVVLPVLYLLLYMARKQQYQGWLGMALAGAACSLILFVLRSAWITDLLDLMKEAPVHWETPTIGGMLSYLQVTEIARSMIVLLLPLPSILLKFEPQLGMETAVAALTLVTIPTTFFGWSYDQTMLLVPVTQIIAWIYLSRSAVLKAALLAAGSLALGISYYQKVLDVKDVFYGWLPLGLWVVFGLVWHQYRKTGALNARDSAIS